MKQREISELITPLPQNYENIFNVYQNKDNTYFYNLLQTVVIPELPYNYLTYYTIKPKDTWPVISYYLYDTTNMWWLIMLTNKMMNPTTPLEPGLVIKAIKSEYIGVVINSI